MSNTSNEGANQCEGSPAVGRTSGSTQQIHRKLGKKPLPFYKLLKKSETFEWTQEARDAFQALKRTLSTSPVLVAP